MARSTWIWLILRQERILWQERTRGEAQEVNQHSTLPLIKVSRQQVSRQSIRRDDSKDISVLGAWEPRLVGHDAVERSNPNRSRWAILVSLIPFWPALYIIVLCQLKHLIHYSQVIPFAMAVPSDIVLFHYSFSPYARRVRGPHPH